MNYLILIIVAVVGIALGTYFARRGSGGLITEQTKKKLENSLFYTEYLMVSYCK